jgi:hypothetical protein
MAQRRKPQPGQLSDSRTPVDEEGDHLVGIYKRVNSGVQSNYFIDYRAFGRSFYGRFFTSDLNQGNYRYAVSSTTTDANSDMDLSETYPATRTSPIASTFSYQISNAKGFPDTYDYPHVSWEVEGAASGTDSIYMGVRWTADNDPAPYNLIAYQTVEIADTFDTYYEYRTVSSFPTTIGYTGSNMTSSGDSVTQNVGLYGIEVEIGQTTVLPLNVDRFSVTPIVQTPGGSPVTPSSGAGGSMTISTLDTDHEFRWLETQYDYRRVTKQTPLSQQDGAIYATRT